MMKRKIIMLLVTFLLATNIFGLFLVVQAEENRSVFTNVIAGKILNEERIILSPGIEHVDKVIDKMFVALAENDYQKFLRYYKPGSTGVKEVSHAVFVKMHEDMINKGGRFISKKMVEGRVNNQIVGSYYIITFENNNYVSKLSVVASDNNQEQCILKFKLDWFDAKEVNVVNNITDNILFAIIQDNYDVFCEKFSPALRSHYSKKEFQELRNDILDELGSYRGNTNTSFYKEGNVLFVVSDLYF